MSEPIPATLVVDTDLVRRYYLGELTASEEAKFEERLLTDPKFADAVLLDQALRDGMQGQRAPVHSQVANITGGKGAGSRWGFGLGLAASLMLGAFAGALWQRTMSSGIGVGIANPPRMVFDTFRGEVQAAKVDAGAIDSPISIIEVAVPTDAEEVFLTDGNNAFGPLSIDSDGFVRVLLTKKSGQALSIEYRSNGVRVVRKLR
jgi:hypothetical protein